MKGSRLKASVPEGTNSNSNSNNDNDRRGTNRREFRCHDKTAKEDKGANAAFIASRCGRRPQCGPMCQSHQVGGVA